MKNILQAEKINVSFDSLKILKDISFCLKKKEFLALIGPSGCGKTTLLKILGGLIRPNSGKVFFAGRQLSSPKKKIAFVFQKSNLLPWLTVSQNIALPLLINKVSKKNIKIKVTKMLKLIKLEEFKDFYPAGLSGGMEQKVAIARAITSNAEILLLDEPFGSQDALSREKMNQELLHLWQHEKKTIILVTHSIQEAIFVSNRVLALTLRPAKIKKEFKINLPYPRSPTVISTQKFNHLYQKIRKEINY